MYSLDEFQYEDSAVADESLRRIEALIVEVEKRETDLQLAQKLQAEAEQRRLQAEQYSGDVEMQLESLKKHNAELQEQLANKQTEEIGIMETENEEKLSNDIIKSITPESACGLNKIMHGVAKGIDVDDGSMINWISLNILMISRCWLPVVREAASQLLLCIRPKNCLLKEKTLS